ncbi:hypothetical protein PTTG_30396 [Puccinia triticina 1-1 BBBD Race 1]|uniref:Uncharacterized protein n=1 Tax=Puccinia triticina (isolate 1-1 / race 1 (BBBD)) TaxID=630390 RepID=A0A180FYV5_PUCT1|nr:hypothetical protein PTTG_30396 [Puccinia triticina 1-1 BBBD Race 1]
MLSFTLKSLQELPLEFRRREFPGAFDGKDKAAYKRLVKAVREIQRHVRYSVREILLSNIVPPKAKKITFIDDVEVPDRHTLADSILHHLQPDGASANGNQASNSNQQIIFVARVAHMRLQTIDNVMNPTLGQPSQWDLISEKIKELATRGADYRAAWGQAILSKDEAIFDKIKGSTKTFGEVRHGDDILTPLPDEHDVQLKLDRLLQSQAGRPCGSSGPSH